MTKQIIFYVIGLVLILNRKKINIKWVRILYIIFNMLLLYLLLFGNRINGSKCWINILGITFQPSEFMKVILIIYLSIISNKYNNNLFIYFIITLIPSILTFLEPDSGNVIMYIVIMLSLYLFNLKNYKKVIIGGSISFVIIFLISYVLISRNVVNYRFDRITSLINNNSYQLTRSLINIGNASFFGTNRRVSVPFDTTDFAFQNMISKIGIVGIILFLLFNMSFNIYALISIKKYSGYKKNILFSFCILKIVNESIHMLMNIGLFPITGIPLPFISIGGSNLISYFILIAISCKDYKVD